MLRRAMVFFIALLMVFPAFAGAEEETLFRARDEQGLWGYINAKGEWVIEPQFRHGAAFGTNDYALVESGGWGFIDRKGNWVVEPHDSVGDLHFLGDTFTGWLEILEDFEKRPDGTNGQGSMGFFDVRSGYFSGMRDDWYIYPRYTESDLIPVSIYDKENDRDLLGYVNRRNGELAVPYRYDPGTDPELFHDGVAHVYDYDETDVDMEGEPIGHFIDEQGNTVPLEEGFQIRYGTYASCGRILVQDTATGLYGYVDTRGKLVIPAVYPSADHFQADRAWVQFNETESGLIDPDGNEIMRFGDMIYLHEFECGYAPFYSDRMDAWVALDGRIIDKVSVNAVPVQENRFWEYAGEYYRYLTDEEGNILSPKYILEIINKAYFFDDGLACVQDENGLWGYVNEDGQEVIPCQWESAGTFDDGLAEVVKDGKMAYIDREGKIVWQEK